MSLQPIHNYLIRDKEILPVNDFTPCEIAGSIYEVVRVISGVPIFLEDHLARLFVSARLAQMEISLTKARITSLLKDMIIKNQVCEGNIFILYNQVLTAFFIAHNYPEEKLYAEGIHCGILQAERELPNAKVIQTPVRTQANALIEKNGYFEVLLVDQQQRITEGSRSNVFFIRNNALFTPPGNEVLLGVTRKKAILLAKILGLEVHEEDVYLQDLNRFHAAFITGTSPKFLPIRKIEDVSFQTVNDKLKQLIESYNILIDEYISKNQSD